MDDKNRGKVFFYNGMILEDILQSCSNNLPAKVVDEPRMGRFVYVILDGTQLCWECATHAVEVNWLPNKGCHRHDLAPVTYLVLWEDEARVDDMECPDCGRSVVHDGGPTMNYQPWEESEGAKRWDDLLRDDIKRVLMP